MRPGERADDPGRREPPEPRIGRDDRYGAAGRTFGSWLRPVRVRTIARVTTHRRSGLIAILGVGLLAGCSGSSASGVPGGDAAPAPSLERPGVSESATQRPVDPSEPIELAAPSSPDRTVEGSGGFRLAALSSEACTAIAPEGWTMTTPARSDRTDLLSADGSMFAGYGILAINTALQGYAYAYAPPMNDPDLYSEDPASVAQGYGRIIVGQLGGARDLATQDLVQAMPGYVLAVVGGSTHAGAIFFHETGFPGDGVNYSYALPMYFAFTTLDRWEDQGALVARVAVSIRCTTQFQPPDDYPIVEADEAGTAGDPNGDDPGYNPQLGTEPVSDPTTGENYLVDPSVNWSETGPDGPGYYVQKGGGDYQKLQPGRID